MLVVGTAGHVDHGKSTLLRALTDMEPDRLAEERRRGLSIELGYVWTVLPDGNPVAFVDVPGHRRFVGTTLAGLGPLSAVLLVVAADGGWSAQTVEHVAAVHALGIVNGVVAVTRCDLADPRAVQEHVARQVAGTALERWPVIAVSAVSGQGLGQLRAALSAVAAALGTPSSDSARAGAADLWVDRAFTVRGSGTVVTGTLVGGSVTADDTLTLLRPSGAFSVGVRRVETMGQPVDRAVGPARVALNLRNVPVDRVRPGDRIVQAERLQHAPSLATSLEARLTWLPSTASLPRQLHLHVGTADRPVRVHQVDQERVRLRWSAPLPVWPGDRGVLREPARGAVLAGLQVRPRQAAERQAAERQAPVHAEHPAQLDRLLRALRADPLAAPDRETLRALPQELVRRLAVEGELVLLPGGVALGAHAAEHALRTLRLLPAPFTTSQARQALGTSRRVVLPLLEHLDATGQTHRLPDDRRTVTAL